MKEIVLSIIVAFSLTTHLAMAVPPNYGYGGFPEATHLVGRDGLCLEKLPWSYKGNNFPRLSPCDEHKQTQLWTVVGDGTIRPKNPNLCLVPGDFVGVMFKTVDVRVCDQESNSNKRWTHKKDGTIVHVESGMVLTGDSDYVTLQRNENTPSQSWEASENLAPMTVNIKWQDNGFCLQSTEDSNNVGLDGCYSGRNNQKWALYGDGTIRQDVNKNYCLTSEQDLGRFVVMSKCENKPQQRWNLGAKDSTIDHPNTNMVMDVLPVPHNGFSLAVVTNYRDGSTSQKWIIN